MSESEREGQAKTTFREVAILIAAFRVPHSTDWLRSGVSQRSRGCVTSRAVVLKSLWSSAIRIESRRCSLSVTDGGHGSREEASRRFLERVV